MQELTKTEMQTVEGGGTITASMLTAVYKLIGVIYDIGESLGSYIRRQVEGKKCDI